MRIEVLGSANSIGHPHCTTAFLVDDDTLVDCGSGVGRLTVEQLLAVRQVLLTHSHLDHSGYLPLLADVHATHGGPGVTVHALQETTDILRAHLFNGQLWPDYTRPRDGHEPWVRLAPLDVGDTVQLCGGVATALPAEHSVPAIGWLLEGRWRALAFTGDSGPCPAFWHWASNVPSLTDVICEITYPSAQQQQAGHSGHLTPASLAPLLSTLPPVVHLWLSHLTPGHEDAILAEVRANAPESLHPDTLSAGTVIEL